ncbi:MAG: sugar phosphate nucleotidyltransferase, partial [Pseudomonadota bacterium]|nr:sugar phosphate nucleotidyltransferase [Pseudomonadota bacterium]
MINIILCGGSGTRLWPLSRTMLPKQFVRLFEGRSLFQDTVLRNAPLCSHSIMVSNTEQYFLAVDQLDQLKKTNSHASLAMTDNEPQYLLEPVGRNTAPAIALACMVLDADDIVFVTTSDHLVKDQAAYEKAVLEAKTLAEKNNLVTFGIKPEYPETGFGYIINFPEPFQVSDFFFRTFYMSYTMDKLTYGAGVLPLSNSFPMQ